MKRIVFKNHRTAAAKVTAELNIHPEDTMFPQKEPDENFTNPTSTAQLQLLSFRLLTATLRGEKDGVMIIRLDVW